MSCIGYDNNCICFNCIDLDQTKGDSTNNSIYCSGEFPCEASTAAAYLEKENKELRELLFRSRSVIDELMGDTDLNGDDSKEFTLMQEINEVLK